MEQALINMRNVTVKMEYEGFSWTGSIIASRTNPPQTIILSCAHAIYNDQNQIKNTNVAPKVFFYNSNIGHNAGIVFSDLYSDLLIVFVNHRHTNLVLPFFDVRPGAFNAFRQPIHCVGHSGGNVSWIYHRGCIATTLFDNNINPRYSTGLQLFGHNAGTPRGSSGGAMISDGGEIVGMQLMAHASSANLLNSNILPTPPVEDADPQVVEAYQAYMESRSFVTLHGVNFEICKEVLLPFSNLSFASSINYLDSKIRQLIPNHNNRPLNDVIASYVFGT